MTHKVLKKDLKENNILPIYLDFKSQQRYRGHALLLKRLEEREPPKDSREYEFTELGDFKKDRKQDKIQIIYNWEWWRIKFITGPEKGFETAVKIAYYQKTFWTKENE